jgi:pimeloyl-ACP methyl ester carboxylesterase
MPLIAARDYHAIAPDLRGYGVTTGWDGDYDGDVASFRLSRLVRDILALRTALGHQRVAAVVGHDFGSPVAAWCALPHPHIFGCVALLSAPFPGPPRPGPDPWPHIDAALSALQPPRKHYQRTRTLAGLIAARAQVPRARSDAAGSAALIAAVGGAACGGLMLMSSASATPLLCVGPVSGVIATAEWRRHRSADFA